MDVTRSLGLLPQFNQLLLKRETHLLNYLSLHLPSVHFLRKISSSQDNSLAISYQRKKRGGSIYIVCDFRDELHLIHLREVLDKGCILCPYNITIFLKSVSKLGRENKWLQIDRVSPILRLIANTYINQKYCVNHTNFISN